jgi:alpha-tubulin suppressor-like RCC1 family protein
VIAIAAGGYHSLALKADGTVVAWGAGGPGQSGDPNYGQATVPAGLTGVTSVAAGQAHSLALKQDGTVVAWGDNRSGGCAVPPELSGSRVTAVAAGAGFSLNAVR